MRSLFVLVALLVPFGAAAENRTAIFAGGCFWCVEADFERVDGVVSVVSGYTGGTGVNPTYAQVSTGKTGHYEAVRITYDPAKVSYDILLWAFFRSVNPTDPGGQFCDRGDPYRTAIFVENEEERARAEKAKAEAEAALGQTVVTPILKAGPFYEAEAEHQDYYKGSNIVLTRFGPRRQATAYTLYRAECNRDRRVLELWGKDAPFAGH